MSFSAPGPEHVAFIDETGDHGLEKIDPNFPIFAICAVTTTVLKYTTNAAANLKQIKYHYWGHECEVIHGYKIRKKSGPFQFLKDQKASTAFYESLCLAFEELDATIVSAAIHKPNHKKQYSAPDNPFFLSLQFVLERLKMQWGGKISAAKPLLCVFEARGRDDDARTTDWFNEICAGKNFRGEIFPFISDFKKKEQNVCGHQYADLAAYTIARFVETGDETRKDWTVVKKRLRKSLLGNIQGYGLKTFP
jgi:hypothetical protein